MNEPKIDPEKLAALLDGRLTDAERDEVIERLAASEAELDAYVDAVAVVHELEEEDAADDASDASITARRFAWTPRRLAMAAAIAGLALAPALWWRSRTTGPPDPAALAALVATGRAPTDGYPPLWSTTRGSAEPVAPAARAARLGVRLVDLELAVRAGDLASISAVAGDIARLLDSVPAGGPVAAVYREIAREPTAPPDALRELLAQAQTAVIALSDAEVLGLAAWAEAARLAAAGRDAGFFRARGYDEWLERAERVASLSAEASDAAAAVAAAIAAGGASHDWSTLERSFTRLVQTLTD